MTNYEPEQKLQHRPGGVLAIIERIRFGTYMGYIHEARHHEVSTDTPFAFTTCYIS